MADPGEQTPPPACMGCGGLQRDLVAVQRLKTRDYVLRTFRWRSVARASVARRCRRSQAP
jgi:hypothetical protein